MTNHCGSCTACCKVFAVSEIPNKTAGTWCQHCDIGVGCKVYEVRPKVCADFECLWLQSQKRGGASRLAAELRPDRCKVVFAPSTNPRVMAALSMAPLAWERPVVRKLIDVLVSCGTAVVAGAPAATDKLMFTAAGQHEVKMTPPDKDGMQWNITKEQPQ
jgi:hypothetical protein